MGFAEGDFGGRGDPRDELLSILSVHLMRGMGIEKFLERRGITMDIVEDLVMIGDVAKVKYMVEEFYVKKLSGRSTPNPISTPNP